MPSLEHLTQLFELPKDFLMMFESTKPGAASEDRKARIKNHNLPILQHLYMGDPDEPLRCAVTGTPAFVAWPCVVRGRSMQRFRIDFNHIRQRALQNKQSGVSVDKGRYDPSHLFRSYELDNKWNKSQLIEFMTIMPVCTEYHSYISQSSSYGDILLNNFDPKTWPWHLRSKKNFDRFVKQYDLAHLDYKTLVDHLNDIDQPKISSRDEFQPYRHHDLGIFDQPLPDGLDDIDYFAHIRKL
jgi:hypothetical protein